MTEPYVNIWKMNIDRFQITGRQSSVFCLDSVTLTSLLPPPNINFPKINPSYCYSHFLKKKFYIYLFLRDKERQREHGRGKERGRRRIRSRHQAPSCQHRVGRGAGTYKPWDHDLSWSRKLNRLSHPGTPLTFFLNLKTYQHCWCFKSGSQIWTWGPHCYWMFSWGTSKSCFLCQRLGKWEGNTQILVVCSHYRFDLHTCLMKNILIQTLL